MSVENICVVVRSVNERTETACLQIVHSELNSGSPIHVVRDKPFAEAHIESMRLATIIDAKWSLFLDADVLLKRGAIANMLSEAESFSSPFYMLNFRILDRGFGGPAYAGVHLYKTKHLRTALQFKNLAYEAQRPETQLCVEVAHQARIPTFRSVQLIGLHGYKQFYADIYRTTFVRAIKFKPWLDHLFKRYRARYESIRDDMVMFWGLVDGMIYSFEHKKAPLDKNFYQERTSQLLNMLGLEEKAAFTLDRNVIERILREYVPDLHYSAIQHYVCSSNPIAISVPSRLGEIRRRLRSLGKRLKQITI